MRVESFQLARTPFPDILMAVGMELGHIVGSEVRSWVTGLNADLNWLLSATAFSLSRVVRSLESTLSVPTPIHLGCLM